MYRLSLRLSCKWETLAGLLNIEKDEIRYNIPYADVRSKAEKMLAIFNKTEGFSRKRLAEGLAEEGELELEESVTTGKWRAVTLIT